MPENQKELSSIEIVNKVKDSLEKYRKNFEPNVRDEKKAYYGEIWNNSENRPYENNIFPIIETMVPILTDSIPGAAVSAKSEQFEAQAMIMNQSIEWVNEDQNFPMQLPQAIRESLITGNGYIHQYYDPNACNGDGKIIREVLSWEQVELGGSGEIEKTEKCRIKLKKSKSWLKQAYPAFSEEIDKEKCDHQDDSETYSEGMSRDLGRGKSKNKVPKMWSDEDTLTLIKTYLKDYSLTKIPQEETLQDLEKESQALMMGESPDLNKFEDHKFHIDFHYQNGLAPLYAQLGLPVEAGFEAAQEMANQIQAVNPGGDFSSILFQIKILENHIEAHKVLYEENPNGEKPKYKNSLRCIESVGKTILYDGESKHDHAEIPLVVYYAYPNGTPYAFSEVRNLMESQRMSSLMLFKEYKGLRKVSNPEKLVDKETGLTKDDITNEDGAVYFLPQGTSIRNLEPGSISPQVTNFQMMRNQAIKDISGVNEASQGKTPSPNAAAVTVERLQNQAIGRFRLKSRQIEYYSNRRLYLLTASDILQFWTDEKTLKQGNESFVFSPLSMQELEYDIKISPGSMAGVDKEAFNFQLTQALNGGHITFEEFLQVAEIPRKDKLLEFVKARNEKDAIIQQLSQQLQEYMDNPPATNGQGVPIG